MDISVIMTPEEFDQFRAFQKEKSSLKMKLEDEIGAAFDGIRDKHEALCTLILDAVVEESGTLYANAQPLETIREFKVKNPDALTSALKIADDWFC